jgi:hypothetical protein
MFLVGLRVDGIDQTLDQIPDGLGIGGALRQGQNDDCVRRAGSGRTRVIDTARVPIEPEVSHADSGNHDRESDGDDGAIFDGAFHGVSLRYCAQPSGTTLEPGVGVLIGVIQAPA